MTAPRSAATNEMLNSHRSLISRRFRFFVFPFFVLPFCIQKNEKDRANCRKLGRSALPSRQMANVRCCFGIVGVAGVVVQLNAQ